VSSTFHGQKGPPIATRRVGDDGSAPPRGSSAPGAPACARTRPEGRKREARRPATKEQRHGCLILPSVVVAGPSRFVDPSVIVESSWTKGPPTAVRRPAIRLELGRGRIPNGGSSFGAV